MQQFDIREYTWCPQVVWRPLANNFIQPGYRLTKYHYQGRNISFTDQIKLHSGANDLRCRKAPLNRYQPITDNILFLHDPEYDQIKLHSGANGLVVELEKHHKIDMT